MPEISGRIEIKQVSSGGKGWVYSSSGIWQGTAPIHIESRSWKLCDRDGSDCHEFSQGRPVMVRVKRQWVGRMIRYDVVASNAVGDTAMSSDTLRVSRGRALNKGCAAPGPRSEVMRAPAGGVIDSGSLRLGVNTLQPVEQSPSEWRYDFRLKRPADSGRKRIKVYRTVQEFESSSPYRLGTRIHTYKLCRRAPIR